MTTTTYLLVKIQLDLRKLQIETKLISQPLSKWARKFQYRCQSYILKHNTVDIVIQAPIANNHDAKLPLEPYLWVG